MAPHGTDAPDTPEDITPFRPVTDRLWVAPQLSAADIGKAARCGAAVIVNNRPDGEEPGQPTGAEIKAAAEAAGLSYAEIPVDRTGLSMEHLEAFDEASAQAGDALLIAYCRSGTRSVTLWAHAAARRGEPIDDIIAGAANAGYDLRPHRRTFEALAGAGEG